MFKLFRPRSLIAFINFHIIIAMFVMLLFSYFFCIPFIAVVLHCLLISSFYFILFLIAQFPPIRETKLQPFLFSGLSFFIILLYICDALSLSNWGSTVSFSFVILYVWQLPELLYSVKFSLPIIIASLLFLLGILFKYYFNNPIFNLPRLKLTEYKYHYLLSSVLLLVFLFTFDPNKPGVWEGEPLSGLMLNSTGTHYLTYDYIPIKNNSITNLKENNKPNIIMMHMDAMRSDHMSTYGYYRNTTPFIDSLLTKNGKKIKTGVSICSESICGMVASMGSSYLNKLPDNSPLLPHYLKLFGYHNYFIGTGNFSWENIDQLITGGVDQFSRSDKQSKYSIHDDYFILKQLTKLPLNINKPSYFYLRFMSSHPIGKHFVRYQKYHPFKKSLLSYIFPSWDHDVAINAHDNNTLQADDLINKALEILKNKGYLENYILVIFGDHGDALGEHGSYGHYNSLYQEEIGIPIIFDANKKLHFKNVDYGSLLDLAPTILEYANIPIPSNFEGNSFFSNPEKKRLTYHDSRTGTYAVIQSVNNKLYKYIYHTSELNDELYEIKSDPNEQDNLINTMKSSRVEYLKGSLLNYFKEQIANK